MTSVNQNVFNIHNLNLTFGNNKFQIENINNLSIREGEIVGVLGESGCGKSTFGKCLVGLINERDKFRYNIASIGNYEQESRIEFPLYPDISFNKSTNVLSGSSKELRKYRKYVQMIFQNPRSSLNLSMPVNKILEEAVQLDTPDIGKSELKIEVQNIADKFGIGGNNWDRIAASTAKDLSGGERRRLGIAKVFATNPDIIIADEPVASLDVSVRGKILGTLYAEWENRKREWEQGNILHPLTLIIISHDFDLIQKMAQRVIVFYGDIHVKRGTVVEIFAIDNLPKTMHPYTEQLRFDAEYMNSKPNSSVQNKGLHRGKKIINNGCVYVNKCNYAQDQCFKDQPGLELKDNRRVACYEL